MPGFDGTGPMGNRRGFGRGNGQCRNVDQSGEMSRMSWKDAGGGRGRGGGRCMGIRMGGCYGGEANSVDNCRITEGDRAFLEVQKSHLENRLHSIKQKIESLSCARPDEGEVK